MVDIGAQRDTMLVTIVDIIMEAGRDFTMVTKQDKIVIGTTDLHHMIITEIFINGIIPEKFLQMTDKEIMFPQWIANVLGIMLIRWIGSDLQTMQT